MIEAEQAPAGAADVKDRHRHQRDVVLGPGVPVGPLVIGAIERGEEIGVRQHRALRLSGGAGGIELHRDVLPADSTRGSSRLWASRQVG